MDKQSSKGHIKSPLSKNNVKNVSSGKVSRNPFINFLRDYRKSNKNNLRMTELTKRGAQLWRGMSDREKSPYLNISKQAPRYQQTRRRGRRRRKRRRRRRRSRSRSRSRSPTSSVTTESSYDKRKDKEKKRHDDKHKERNTGEGNKTEKPSHGSSERNNCNKKADEYEVKYKNSRYEDSRDFI